MLDEIKNPRAITLISVLTALCLAIQLSPRPPNVEFTSLFTFIVGLFFGSAMGVFFGSFIMFFNSFFSPWGFAGLNMPFQMLGMGLIGLSGSLYGKRMQGYASAKFCFEVSVLGGFFTLVYDFITNLGVALSFVINGINPPLAVATAIAYGAPFSAIHVCSNIAVFGVVLYPLVASLNHVLVVKRFG